jgi:hypothetical protein
MLTFSLFIRQKYLRVIFSKKSQWGANKMQKGINLGDQNCTTKTWGSKSHNCEIWGVKIAQLKLGGQNRTIVKLGGLKLHLSLFYL